MGKYKYVYGFEPIGTFKGTKEEFNEFIDNIQCETGQQVVAWKVK